MRSVPILCGLTLAAIVLATSSARADAIDGHWCSKDGRRLEIAGPTIVTPFGARVGGEYDRHHFSYIAPASDKNAGQKIDMTLMGEVAVHIRVGSAETEVWNRCGPPVSFAPRWRDDGRINEKRTGNV